MEVKKSFKIIKSIAESPIGCGKNGVAFCNYDDVFIENKLVLARGTKRTSNQFKDSNKREFIKLAAKRCKFVLGKKDCSLLFHSSQSSIPSDLAMMELYINMIEARIIKLVKNYIIEDK